MWAKVRQKKHAEILEKLQSDYLYPSVMKRLILSILSVFLPMIEAFSYEIKVGNIWYSVDVENLCAEVIKHSGYTNLKKVDIPPTINDGITYYVTSIGKEAFEDCRYLQTVKIPYVKSIGKEAFRNCSSLINIEIPDGVTSIEESTL